MGYIAVSGHDERARRTVWPKWMDRKDAKITLRRLVSQLYGAVRRFLAGGSITIPFCEKTQCGPLQAAVWGVVQMGEEHGAHRAQKVRPARMKYPGAGRALWLVSGRRAGEKGHKNIPRENRGVCGDYCRPARLSRTNTNTSAKKINIIPEPPLRQIRRGRPRPCGPSRSSQGLQSG